MNAQIDGTSVQSEADFHREIAAVIDFGHGYGKNLDALRDRLGTDLERPIHLTWCNAGASRAAMPKRFDLIVGVLRKIEEQDRRYGWDDRFELTLA